MSKFIVIELSDNPDYETDAAHIHNVANLVEDAMAFGQDSCAKFETVNTLNHQELSDVVKAIRKYPNVHNAVNMLHGRVSNGTDIDQAIEWLYEELEE